MVCLQRFAKSISKRYFHYLAELKFSNDTMKTSCTDVVSSFTGVCHPKDPPENVLIGISPEITVLELSFKTGKLITLCKGAMLG